MRILILGAGAVGSIMAMRLAWAGHDVWLLARGSRLSELTKDPFILARHFVTGELSRTYVHVAGDQQLQRTSSWDLMIVAVQAHQLEGAMPLVDRVVARHVLFMMNMVGDLHALRERVGVDRFLIGLPALLGEVRDGELRYAVLPGALRFLQITTIGALPDHFPRGVDRVKRALEGAGFATTIQEEMQTWLLTHAGFMMPIMVAGLMSDVDRPLTWATSRLVARGILDNLRLIKRAGHRIEPWNMQLVSMLPPLMLALGVWASFQFRLVRVVSQAHITHAQAEVRHLIDALLRLDPNGQAKTLMEFSRFLDGVARDESPHKTGRDRKRA